MSSNWVYNLTGVQDILYQKYYLSPLPLGKLQLLRYKSSVENLAVLQTGVYEILF